MNRYEKVLWAILKQFASHGAMPEGFAYRSHYDFVFQHGQWSRPKTFPEGVQFGAPRQCFGNAIAACVLHGWRYVEGFAYPCHKAIPIHHAWNLDAEGNAYDLTWGTRGLAYLGVEFSLGRADDSTWNGDATVLDDWKRGWALLREKWQGEDFGKEWEPSEGLLYARRLKEKATLAGRK